MKYIRTKDGRILKGSNYGFGVGMPYKNYDVKVADTIEELCDCLILWKQIILIRHSKAKYDIDEIAIKQGTYAWNKEKYKEAYKNTYGAIWTEKGLIYVAKMNEKGELELL